MSQPEQFHQTFTGEDDDKDIVDDAEDKFEILVHIVVLDRHRDHIQ